MGAMNNLRAHPHFRHSLLGGPVAVVDETGLHVSRAGDDPVMIGSAILRAQQRVPGGALLLYAPDAFGGSR
jgi:hypothetical protein